MVNLIQQCRVRSPHSRSFLTHFSFVVLCLSLILTGNALYAQEEEILILPGDQTSAPDETQLTLPAGEQVSAPTQSFLVFYTNWRNFVAAFEAGNSAEWEGILKQLVDLRRHAPIPKITELSISTIEYGNLALSQNKPDEAVMLFQAAQGLDPALPAAYYNEARAYLKRGIAGWIPAFRLSLKGFSSPLSILSGKIYFYSKIVLILTATFVVLGFAFSLILLIKYNRLLTHNVEEEFGSTNNPAWIPLIVWLLLFLPVFLFLGPLWLGPFWLALFWGYARRYEKILAVVLIAVFALAYPVYKRITQISAAVTNPTIAPYITAFSQGPSAKAISDFEKYAAEHPDDSEATIFLAYLYKSDYRYQPAAELLQKYILNNPSDPRAYNNLANLNFLLGETDSALQLSQRASMLDPQRAIYRYNLSKIQRAKFNFIEAQRLLDEAKATDPDLILSYEAAAEAQLIDVTPTQKLVWSRIRDKTGDFLSLLWNPFSLFVAGLILFILIPVFLFLRNRRFARECMKCGKAFCRKCQPGTTVYDFCIQCLHIFIKKDGISPVSRKEKMYQIQRRSKREDLFVHLSSLILPGFGGLYRNQISNVLILMLWLFFIAILVFHWKFASRISYLEPSDSLKGLTLMCVVFMALIYVFANLLVLRKPKG